ncbi:MAG: DUF935 family protein [Elusimicrobiaceae bacterium]
MAEKIALKAIPTGDSGNQFFNGIFTDEYLTALQGQAGAIIYDKMRRSDAQIGKVLRMIKNPILSCEWDFLPGDEEDSSKLHADFCREYFFKANKMPFGLLLQQVLTCFEFGFSVFEKVWGEWEYQGKLYHGVALKMRLQKSIEAIDPLTNLMTQIKSDGAKVDIPFDDLVFFVLAQEGDDMHGNSLLRNSYMLWDFKKEVMKVQAIGIERMAVGTPVVTVPKGVDPSSPEYIAVKTMAKNMVTHENSYVIIPETYKFEIIAGKFDSAAVQSTIDSYDSKIAGSTLTQFLELGQNGNGGSYSLGADQSQIFIDGLQFVVGYIEEIFSRYVIRQMIDVNFGPQKVYPTLRGLNLNKAKVKEFIDYCERLIKAGAVKFGVEDEQDLRKRLKIRPLSDEEIAGREKVNTPSAVPVEPSPTEPIITEPVKKMSEASLAKAKKHAQMIDVEAERVYDFMRANLLTIKDKLVADIEATLNRGSVETQGLKNIELGYVAKYKDGLARKIAYLAKEGYNLAKQDARSHMAKKLAEDKEINPKDLPKSLKAYVINKIDAIVDGQTLNMRLKAIYTAQKAIDSGLSIKQSIAEVNLVLADFTDGSKVSAGADNVVAESINNGSMFFFTNVASDQIIAYRVSAVIDADTTKICAWLNGHVYAPGSVELAKVQPPLHYGCRTILEPIYADDPDAKDIVIDNELPPPSIMALKQF